MTDNEPFEMMTNKKRLVEIKERMAAATPGPWRPPQFRASSPVTVCPDVSMGAILVDGSGRDRVQLDARFICHAREDIPWLVRRLEETEKVLYSGCELIARLLE